MVLLHNDLTTFDISQQEIEECKGDILDLLHKKRDKKI